MRPTESVFGDPARSPSVISSLAQNDLPGSTFHAKQLLATTTSSKATAAPALHLDMTIGQQRIDGIGIGIIGIDRRLTVPLVPTATGVPPHAVRRRVRWAQIAGHENDDGVQPPPSRPEAPKMSAP